MSAPTIREVGGFAVMAVTTTALGHHLLERSSRRSWRRLGIVAAVAFAAVSLTHASGLLRWLHDDVFERVGGEFDELATWLVALAGAIVATIIGRAAARAAHRLKRGQRPSLRGRDPAVPERDRPG